MQVGRRALLGALGVSAGASAFLPTTPLFAAAAGEAPPLIPIETFVEKAAMDDLTMSPDGLRVLARMQVKGKEVLGIYTLASGEFTLFGLPDESEIAWYRWAGNGRFIVSLGAMAEMRTDMPGNVGSIISWGRGTRLFSYDIASKAATFIGLKDGGMQGDDLLYLDPAGEFLLLSVRKGPMVPAAVYRFALKDNSNTRVERGLDGVYQWYADNAGVVRAGMGYDRKGWMLYYRSTPAQPLTKVGSGQMTIFERAMVGEMCFVAGTDDGYILANPSGSRFNAVFKFNFATQTIGEQIFACPTNDVTSLDFGETGHDLEAIRYIDDRERIHWVNPDMKEIQDGIDRAMPNRQNRIVTRSTDGVLMLIHSSTTRDAGTYYVFDLATTKLNRLVKSNVKLPAAQLSTMESVHYTARDGLEIPAYLTLPNGREPKGLPLVIMAHGGPYGVRDTLGFDVQVQFLANRGYAVLQPNYRGSESYGVDFFKAGNGEWGRKMQDDLDDGMDWLVKRGIVDPKRACMIGGSYGGYTAAWGATRNPERYRCAACFAGVFNLRSQLGYTSDFLYSRAYRQYRSTMQGAETFDLDSVSPALQVDKLKRPILLLHGDQDVTVPIAQSRAYASALAKAGKVHEFHTIKGEWHSYHQEGTLALVLGKYEAFLKTHNPAD
ncbi:MAG: alpha/beta hydrolase family protein [Sphingomonas sp.]